MSCSWTCSGSDDERIDPSGWRAMSRSLDGGHPVGPRCRSEAGMRCGRTRNARVARSSSEVATSRARARPQVPTISFTSVPRPSCSPTVRLAPGASWTIVPSAARVVATTTTPPSTPLRAEPLVQHPHVIKSVKERHDGSVQAGRRREVIEGLGQAGRFDGEQTRSKGPVRSRLVTTLASMTSSWPCPVTRSPCWRSAAARGGRTRNVTSRPRLASSAPKKPPVAPAPTTRMLAAGLARSAEGPW